MHALKKSPFIFLGLSAYLGFSYSPYSLFFFILLLSLCKKKKKFSFAVSLIFLLFSFLGYRHFTCTPLSSSGTFLFQLIDCRLREFKGKKMWHVKGQTRSFNYHLISLYLPACDPPPSLNYYYSLEGSILKNKRGSYFFKMKEKTSWVKKNRCFSFAQMRFNLKKNVRHILEKHIQNKEAYLLLEGLSLGTFEDKDLRYLLSCFGLNHLLAISGFHFSLLAFCIKTVLKSFLRWKKQAYVTLFLLTLYFLFLGFSPSIFRAWIMLCTAEIAPLLNRTSCSKNNLGFALLTLLIIDPSSISSLGFTFSYGTTAALLFGYPKVKKYLSLWIADRPLEEALKISFLDKHLLIILMAFRNGLSLSLAVSLVALPLSLYYFHSFPLLSLFYNIFYPPLICITLIFLFLALFFCITPLGALFFYLAEAMATTSINLLTSFSPPFIFFIYVKKIAIIPLLIYFGSLLFLLLKTIDQKEEFKRSF